METTSRSLISPNTAFRILTVLFIVLASQLGNRTFTLIVLTIGYAHYVLAMIYSRRQLKSIITDARTLVVFSLTTLGAVVLAAVNFPVAWLSVLHHNFNEVYMRDAFKMRSQKTKFLRLSCIVMNISIFLAILRTDPALRSVNPQLVFAAVAFSTIWYATMLIRSRHDFTVRQMIDSSIYEVGSFAVLAVSLEYRVTLLHLFLYHFVFWGLYPIPNMVKKGAGSVRTYVAWNVLLLPIIWVLCANYNISSVSVTKLFGWFGYIHIAMSFGLSREQPTWLIKMFQAPARKLASVAPVGGAHEAPQLATINS